ncbi:MAG: T9SS C-terminal target domain-containing protein, partial [Bacteroidetes bacterium]
DTVLTLTATDQSGNQATCTPIVSVRDSIAPAIACTTDTVTLVIDSAFAQTGQFWPVPGNQPWVDVWDNCYDITLDTIASALDSLGAQCDEALFNQSHLVQIHISDGTQTASCMLSAVVVDTIAPYFACDTIQVQLNGATDTAFISDPMLFSQASMPAWDNCGVAELSASQSAFPYDPQPVPVSVTVSDAAGNHYTCTSHVVTLLPNAAGDARQLAGTFRLSPNPTSGTLSLEWALPVAAPLEMRLTDLSGRTVERIELPEVLHGRQTFDWHHLPEGVYLIMITDGKRVHTDRIVILP